MNDHKELLEILKNIGKYGTNNNALISPTMLKAADAIEQLVKERDAAVKDNAPTVDAVEVVRCRDCVHARKLKDNFYGWEYSCKHFNTHSTRSNDYCSYGERRNA